MPGNIPEQFKRYKTKTVTLVSARIPESYFLDTGIEKTQTGMTNFQNQELKF